MNVPLGWLSDYVPLPKSEKILTDKLTMVGHMLDKRREVGGKVVIDLELRGNRADMFGLIGVARDVSAIFGVPFRLPKVAPLPKTDSARPLVGADKSIADMVKRFMAIRMDVTIGPSPKWLVDRLKAYGIEPFNNVVDVTNYVMVETSHPMHAFDANKLSDTHLTLRYAKTGEKFETIQQGATLKLTKEDIAICDTNGVQSITCIGGAKTKVSNTTKTIILETAVYDSASCRRTARRHKIATEGGGRHEKHQDPQELPFALARAVQILQDIAKGKIIGGVSDFYPYPSKPLVLTFRPKSVDRLVGVSIPTKEIVQILRRLDFLIETKKSKMFVTVPSFRTDIKQEADIVEEIVRIYGYEKIPLQTLSGELPKVGTPAHIVAIEKIRSTLVSLQMNEVITSTLIPNDAVQLFEQNGTFAPVVTLVNAPDPDIATLRPTLLPNLVHYAKRSLGFRQKRIAFFELGNVYGQPKPKKYDEHMTLGLIMGGETSPSWNKQSTQISFFDLKGVVEALVENLGVAVDFKPHGKHPSFGKIQATIFTSDEIIGTIGVLSLDETLFCAELDVQKLIGAQTTHIQPYVIAPVYPPIVEDLSFTVPEKFGVGEFLIALKAIHSLVVGVSLLDVYENTRTFHITYQDPKKNLTTDDVLPIRRKLITLAKEKFEVILKSA